MIIQENQNKTLIFFNPETIKERKFLDKFPGLLREGLHFFSPNKPRVVQNLYQRIRKYQKDIKYTAYVQGVLSQSSSLLELPDTFKYFTKPLPHQDLALRFCYTNDNVGLLLEPGLGKTKVVLDYIYLKGFKKSLVVCPKSLLFVWEEEVVKHRPEIKIYVVKSTTWEDEKASILDADLIVVNYDKAVSMEDDLRGVNFEFIGLDEGLIKDHTTSRTKSITRLSTAIPNRFIMSGTLVNNGPEDLFSPIRFLEPSLFGTGITRFKERYAVTSKNKEHKHMIFGYRDTPEIKSVLQACSIVMRKEEWLKDLPKKEFTQCLVQMGDKQRDYYTQLANNWLLIDKENSFELEVENVLTQLCKLTQISNGFLYYKEDTEETLDELYGEGKKKVKPNLTYYFEDQPKVDKLLRLLDKEVAGRRTLVWFNMTAEKEILEQRLHSEGISFLTIAGKEKKIGEKVGQFNNDPSIRVLLCQARSVNYGLTLLGREREEDEITSFEPRVSDEIFYSLNFSLEVYLQQIDRIHRIGQVNVCKYWVILANTSIEKHIADRLEHKLICNREMLVDITNTAQVLS